MSDEIERIWVQNKNDRGYGPDRRWAEPSRRITIPVERVNRYDPYGVWRYYGVLLDLMERDLGRYSDRFDPYLFSWVEIHSDDPETSTITSGSVYVGRNDEVKIKMPNFHTLISIWNRPVTPPQTNQFDWDALDPEEFEALVFRLFSAMTNEFTKVMLFSEGVLSAVRKSNGARMLIHAKHSSLSDIDIIVMLFVDAGMEGIPFDEVMIVTSGTFTEDGIRWTEEHNNKAADAKQPIVTLVPQEQLAVKLERYPHLIELMGMQRIPTTEMNND